MSYAYRGRTSNFSHRQNSYHSRPSGRGIRKENIDPRRFVKSAQLSVETDYVAEHAFADFAINPLIQTNLAKNGFITPSAIQDQTIQVGLAGKDIVGIANTGTGKTAAFAVPILHQLMAQPDKRALIMAPTRELAQQIDDQCRVIATGSGISGALLIGGTPMGPQLRDLRANPKIVIGTPGRIKDHSRQRSLDLAKFNIVVLDEVDRMLDMGFIDDIRYILNETANAKQSFFFSATLDPKVRSLIEGFAINPTYVTVKTGDTSANVEQDVVTYGNRDEKIDKLHDLLLQDNLVKTLVFSDTHRSVEKLCNELLSRGFNADAIHGGKSQSQRERALKRFKDNQIKILVATDVAARGIDVPDITHVINYSAPQSYTDYVHRIGRTGRAGKLGYAFTFVEK